MFGMGRKIPGDAEGRSIIFHERALRGMGFHEEDLYHNQFLVHAENPP